MSGESWKASARAPRRVVEQALLAADVDEGDPVLSGREVAEDADEWLLEAWFDHRPDDAELAGMTARLQGHAATVELEHLPEQDWITLSQAGMDPILAGRFHVRTPDHAGPTSKDVVDLVIPASQAFGTGQHPTTAGCLTMLDRMEGEAVSPMQIIDVGTGTGVLAFAARHLWPRAHLTATDIDPVCESVFGDNARLNAMALVEQAKAISFIVADGLDHPLLQQRTPYDLLIANILAGPLIDLAPAFARAVREGGSILLAGLLATQEDAVATAYMEHEITVRERIVADGWTILWLTKSVSRATA